MNKIFTTKGMVEESQLTKITGNSESENEIISWQEWRLNDELVKREVSLHLKQPLQGFSALNTKY